MDESAINKVIDTLIAINNPNSQIRTAAENFLEDIRINNPNIYVKALLGIVRKNSSYLVCFSLYFFIINMCIG